MQEREAKREEDRGLRW